MNLSPKINEDFYFITITKIKMRQVQKYKTFIQFLTFLEQICRKK